MKQLMVMSALAMASAAACAQSSSSSVQLYGLVDAGITHVSGLAKGSDTSLSSGIMDGSRWGLRGIEPISPGWDARFVLESRLEANNGSLSNRPASGSQLPDRLSDATLLGLPAAFQPAVSGVAANIGSTLGVNLPNRTFDRQAFVGLRTPVGFISAGRQYTPAYELGTYFDILGTQSALAPGQLGALPTAIDIRVSNSLAWRYRSGEGTGPLSVLLMVSTSEDKTAPHLRSGMVTYRTDTFGLGAGYNTRRNELNDKSLTSAVLGAYAAMGPHKVSVLGVSIKDDNPTGVSAIAAGLVAGGAPAAVADAVQTAFIGALKQDARLYHVGYRFTTAPSDDLSPGASISAAAGSNTLYIAYNMFKDRLRDADATSYGMVYSYGLSKRTDFNLALVHYNNKDLSQTAPGGTGYLGGVTSTAGKDSNSVALGIRHRF